MAFFLDHLQGLSLLLEEEDRRLWLGGPGEQFTVKACYNHVANVAEMSGPWRLVWYNVVPLKVQFFVWTTVLERISTMDML